MLDDRDYMHFDWDKRWKYRPRGCISGPSAVWVLIIANVVVFILGGDILYDMMSMQVLPFHQDRPLLQSYRLFTSMFVHYGFTHILFNMWGLYLFGSSLEERIGRSGFYALYFISGVSGGLLSLACNWTDLYYIAGGASGALFGVIIAAALFFPDRQIALLFPPIPMNMKTFALAYAAVEVYFELSGSEPGIGHLAHLGGFVGGYIYIKAVYGRQVWGISSLFKRRPRHALYDMKNNILFNRPDKIPQAELDRILDKISMRGINSLSHEEMDTLRQAREEMNGRK